MSLYLCRKHEPAVPVVECAACQHRSYCPACAHCWRVESGFCEPSVEIDELVEGVPV